MASFKLCIDPRRRAVLGALGLALAAAPAPALAAARAGGHVQSPTRGQIRTAIAGARRSPDLWATVNICNSPRYRNVIGVRGQMPGLGFTSRMTMVFRIDYWSSSSHSFKVTPHTETRVDVARASGGSHQTGIRFTFRPAAGLLRGEVTFQWRVGRRLVGQVTRTTSPGHARADFGDPKGFTASQCMLR
jgi:hypothetical protein